MRKTVRAIGAYGVVNGFGFHGDPREKAKLIRRARMAVDRGDCWTLFEYLVAYGAGTYAGARLRKALAELARST